VEEAVRIKRCQIGNYGRPCEEEYCCNVKDGKKCKKEFHKVIELVGY
jgi:hypothetical protein